MLTQAEIPYSSGKWKGLIAADWQEEIPDFDQWQPGHPGETVVSYQSRSVCRVQTPKGRIYIKKIRALTDAGMNGKDWLSFLKWVLRPSRALAAWRISQRLLAAGFHCARPVLAIRKRSLSGYPTDVFITEEVDAPVISELLPALQAPQQLALAEFLGRELHTFHAAGFVHGDCILRNLCLTAENKLVYLDNDRTRKNGVAGIFHWQLRNLAQIGYSARRCGAAPEFPLALFEEYARQAKWSISRRQKTIRRLCEGIEKRLRNRTNRTTQR